MIDSMVSSRNPQGVVTSNAYLLFYRRRQDRPLGPGYLQKIVDEIKNPDFEDAADGDSNDEATSRNPSRSPSGNGLRLGDSSRNGSSSAFGVGAGALRGGGSASVGNLQLKGAAAETAEDDDSEMLMGQDEPPSYDDEGYGGGVDDDDANFQGINNHVDVAGMYAPLYEQSGMGPYYGNDTGPAWSFANVGSRNMDDDTFDDAASDAPNMGSTGGDDLDSRMLEDFGDEMGHGINPGMSTPLEEEVPTLLGGENGDDEVANITLDDEVLPAEHHVRVD